MPKNDREILKADPEDGTAPVAYLLLDALSVTKLSSKEFRAVVFIIRRTYGWKVNGSRLKEVKIPFKEWCEVLEMDNSHASTLLKVLDENKHIIRRHYIGPAGKKAGYYYGINTNISEWDVNQQLLRKIASYEKPQHLPENERKQLPKNESQDLRKTVTVPDTNLATPNLNESILI